MHAARNWWRRLTYIVGTHDITLELELHDSIHAVSDLREVVHEADIVLLSVPSKSMDHICSELARVIAEETALLSTTKGIHSDGFKLMSQVISERLPDHPVGVLSGPNLAREVAERHLTASVVASQSPIVRKLTRNAFATKYFRLYSSEDLISVELGGALKNIYAIAAGLADGTGVGQNTRALLITRSLAEMSRLSAHMGGNPLSFLGLAGLEISMSPQFPRCRAISGSGRHWLRDTRFRRPRRLLVR